MKEEDDAFLSRCTMQSPEERGFFLTPSIEPTLCEVAIGDEWQEFMDVIKRNFNIIECELMKEAARQAKKESPGGQTGRSYHRGRQSGDERSVGCCQAMALNHNKTPRLLFPKGAATESPFKTVQKVASSSLL